MGGEHPLVIYWFRQDLRLADNPALSAATTLAGDQSAKLLPIYILDDENAASYKLGGASRWWLHHSLHRLSASLNGHLHYFSGNAQEILPALAKHAQASAVYWTIAYEPWRLGRDKHIKKSLIDNDVTVKVFNGSLLWNPSKILKQDKSPYKVFTPYYRKGCLASERPREPIDKPTNLNKVLTSLDPALPNRTPLPTHESSTSANYRSTSLAALTLTDLNLLPARKWGHVFSALADLYWQIGEAGAKKALSVFIKHGLNGYKKGRDFPTRANVSRLSPHLHFGEISPNQVWYAAQNAPLPKTPPAFLFPDKKPVNSESNGENAENEDIAHFCSELAWREFSYYLLYHFPTLPEESLQIKFKNFPWLNNKAHLKRWQRGMTGYPIVDAGMRELWQTGYMHNRVRMIVGSFLVKNLLIHWHYGRDWFWDCLIDADLANNSASWQWIAGCGADTAPSYRIFNPVLQASKFDPDGRYIKQYVPELQNLPLKYLFTPWEAPPNILKSAGLTLGKTYPQPIVALKESRNRALKIFTSLKA